MNVTSILFSPAICLREARIVDGAIRLFREAGPEEVSLRKLAKLNGISHTKVYHYFSGKDELLTAIKMQALKDLRKHLNARDPVDAAPLERMRAASYSLFNYASNNRDEYMFLFASRETETGLSKDLLALRHEVFNDVVAIANLAAERGEIGLSGRTVANLAWAMLHGLFMLNFQDQLIEGRSFEELFEDALDQMFGRGSKT